MSHDTYTSFQLFSLLILALFFRTLFLCSRLASLTITSRFRSSLSGFGKRLTCITSTSSSYRTFCIISVTLVMSLSSSVTVLLSLLQTSSSMLVNMRLHSRSSLIRISCVSSLISCCVCFHHNCNSRDQFTYYTRDIGHTITRGK